MIKATMKNYAAEANLQIKAKSWQNIQRAVVFLWSELQRVLNRSNPRPYLDSSKEGEPPRKRTGWLQRNVVYDLDQTAGVGRVGVTVNAEHGLFLERGTRKMRPRPWLLVTVNRLLGRLRQIASA